MQEIIYWLIGVFVLLFLVSVAFFFKDILRTGRVKMRKEKAREKESLWVFLVALILTSGIIVGEFIRYHPEAAELSYMGIILIFVGGLLRILARKELDRFFSFEVIIQEGHKLVTSGVYSRIRHPVYLADFILMLGIAFALSSMFGIIAVLVLFLPAVLYRLHAEEKIMIDEFGKEYLRYMEKTKKLIPFVY